MLKRFKLIRSIAVLCMLIQLSLQPTPSVGSVENNQIDLLNLSAADFPGVTGERDTLYGEVVSGIGDYNNDGYGDMLVGGRAWNGWQGQVWMYYGSSEGLYSKADLKVRGEPNRNGWGVCMGHTVVALGDVNGDGFDDFAAGGPGSYGDWDVGKVYIFYGNPDTLPVEGSDADQQLISPIQWDWFGESFRNLGDFNNDGYTDLIVGAPGTADPSITTTPFEKGYGYVFLGSATGFADEPDIALEDDTTFTAFGLVVGAGGDVNGDGFDDAIVGAEWTNFYTGRAHVFLGSASPNPNPTADLILSGPANDSRFGKFVNIISDINGDGFDEIGIRTTNTTGGDYVHQIQIYYGREDISNITDPDIILIGDDLLDEFGYTFNMVGDINNDGSSDLAVGAPGTRFGQPGKVYVYYGGDAWSNDPSRIYIGEDGGDWFGYWVAGSDLDGDNISDLIMSALYYESIGKVYIDFSSNATVIQGSRTGERDDTDDVVLPRGMVLTAIVLAVIGTVIYAGKRRKMF